MDDEELERLRATAVANLDAAVAKHKADLAAGNTHTRAWTPYEFGMESKVGKGWLRVRYPDPVQRPHQYPGIHFTSSQGANSDNSFGGFLAGVTFDEALLLVYGEYLKWGK